MDGNPTISTSFDYPIRRVDDPTLKDGQGLIIENPSGRRLASTTHHTKAPECSACSFLYTQHSQHDSSACLYTLYTEPTLLTRLGCILFDVRCQIIQSGVAGLTQVDHWIRQIIQTEG